MTISSIPKWAFQRPNPFSWMAPILCLLLMAASACALQEHDATTLLEKFLENNNRTAQFLSRTSFDVTVRGFARGTAIPDEKQVATTRISFGRDDQKWRVTRKDDVSDFHNGKFVDVHQDYTYVINDNIYRVERRPQSVAGPNSSDGLRVFVSHDLANLSQKGLGNISYASLSYGVVNGNGGKHFPDVLHDSKVSTDGKAYTIDSHETKLLKAVGGNGTFLIWLNPTAGFVLQQMIVTKTGDDLLDGKPVRTIANIAGPGTMYPTGRLDSYEQRIEHVKTEQIEGVPIIREFVETMTYRFQNGDSLALRSEVSLSNIKANPVFPEGFFSIAAEVPNGTRVQDLEHPQIQYVWSDGKLGLRVDKPHVEELASSTFATDGRWLTWRSVFVILNVVIVLLLAAFLVRRKVSRYS